MIFFNTPAFWHKKPNFLLKLILKPVAYIYSIISTKNYFKCYVYKSEKSKVIAIGGVTVGGSGKTVVTQSICEMLQSKNKSVAILNSGFGRSSNKTLRVNNKIHSYDDVGDEALMLSNLAPVYVDKDRSKSAKLAEREGFDFLILDDGIAQNYLNPDIKLVVIDEEQHFGNGEMFPLGPNRLNFQKIKSDINGVVILGKEPIKTNSIDKFIDFTGPIFYGNIRSDFSQIKGKIIAFCGIGYPEKFFNSLSAFDVIKKVTYPDHYPFSERDLDKLIVEASEENAQLVTTEKDFIRVPKKYRQGIAIIPIKIIWTDSVDLYTLSHE